MSEAHSIVGASSMERWSNCTASVHLAKDLPPQPPSIWAKEGTKAHEIAADFLATGKWLEDIDSETEEAIRIYTTAVLQKFTDDEGNELYIEERFHLEAIHPLAFGTCDAAVWSPNESTLYVFDYKHGAGLAVEVRGNKQLRYYGLGALLSLGLKPKKIVLVVVQPRCFHPDGPVRSEEISAQEVIDFGLEARILIETALDPKQASFKQGDYCRFCPAITVCPELKKKAHESAVEVFEDKPSESFAELVRNYPAEKLEKALELVPRMEAWAEAVRSFAYNEAKAGRCPDGWKLVQKRAMRKWKDEKNTAIFLEQRGLKPDLMYKRKLRSVADIEKLIPKKANRAFLEPYYEKVSSGTTLVPESDKRKAVAPDVTAVFDELKEQ